MNQILPALYATCGISQPSTQGFETDKNHCDLKASISLLIYFYLLKLQPSMDADCESN